MKTKLKLYITGNTGNSLRALRNLDQVCHERLNGDFELEVIDILEHPQLAEDERILATPTLIRQLPVPIRKIVGDLSDKEKVLLGLDLKYATPSHSDAEKE